MPIVEIPRPQLAREVSAEERGRRLNPVMREQFSTFVQKKIGEHGLESINWGSHCYVFASPDNPETVVAVEYQARPEKVREVKISYYLQRIYSTIWPDNFPHWHAALGAKRDLPAATFRKRIHSGGAVRRSVIDLVSKEVLDKDEPKKSITNVVNDCAEYGIPLGIDTYNYDNFMLTVDDAEYYVDTISLGGFTSRRHFPEKGFLRLMADRSFSEDNVRQVITSIDRINALIKEIREDEENRKGPVVCKDSNIRDIIDSEKVVQLCGGL